MPARFATTLLACLTLSACAGGGGGGDTGAGEDDASTPTLDAGRRDSGGGACASGQHRCGGGCIDDLPNEPDNGCRYGCGEPCPTPPDGEAACDDSGTCTFACPPPFHRVGTECVCTPRTCTELGFMCGAPDDGCGSPLDCGSCTGGGVCMTGRCSCPLDEREPNDSRLAIDAQTFLDTMSDADDRTAVWMFGLHSASDVDWFKIAVVDDTDCCWPTSNNPNITVTLDDIPSESNYDLAAYYVCASGGDSTTCSSGMEDNMIGRGCASASSGTTIETVGLDTDCSGDDDSGTLYVRVTSRSWGGSCAPYRLTITVE